ncbi:MAG: histidine kinase N-terminal 7TM domain-containing protein [bacterium]
MTFYNVTTFLAGLVNLALAIFVLIQGKGRPVTRVFSLLALILAVWSFGSWGLSVASSQEEAVIWAHIFFSVSFLPPTFLFLMIFITNDLRRINKVICLLSYLIALFLQFSNWTGYLFQGVTYHDFGKFYFPSAGSVFFLEGINHWSVIGYGIYLLLRKYRLTGKLIEKTRIKYIITAVSIALLGAISNIALLLGLKVYPLAYLTLICCMTLITYTILKHHLMEIEIVIRGCLKISNMIGEHNFPAVKISMCRLFQ